MSASEEDTRTIRTLYLRHELTLPHDVINSSKFNEVQVVHEFALVPMAGQ